MQAPTGANIQSWRWMVVTDADKRAAIAEIYRRAGHDTSATSHAMIGLDRRGARKHNACCAAEQRSGHLG